MEPHDIRINKYIAMCGITSRRGADTLIEEGKVFINGKPAVNGDHVGDNDEVVVNGNVVTPHKDVVMLAVYKPVGVTVTKEDKHAAKTIYDIVHYPINLAYAGRLDRDSEGLLLMTNDGDFINEAMSARNYHEKEYIVKVDKELSKDEENAFARGIYLKEFNRKTRECSIKKTGIKTYSVILTEGLNRQIRRMFEYFGAEVLSLKRIRVVNVKLGNMKPGDYRELNVDEIKALYNAVGIRR